MELLEQTHEVEIRELFDFLYLQKKHLTGSQENFVWGLKRYYRQNKQLSEKQVSALKDIVKFLDISN